MTPDNIPAALAKAIRESNARHFAGQRQRDALLLREYEAECLASWEGRK